MNVGGATPSRIVLCTCLGRRAARLIQAAVLLSLLATFPAGRSVAKTGSYQAVERWARLPVGQEWQIMSAVDIDAHGRIYVLQRAAPSKVMVFAPNGRLLRTWGEGEFPDAHGLRVDSSGNVWITDRKLHQVLQFTPSGRLLLAIGTRGIRGDNASRTALNGPSDVAFGRNGDIFVSDGESSNARVLKYDRNGILLKFWGSKGAGPGQFDVPHSIVTDACGRLFVADRANRRVQIFDEDGTFHGQIAGIGTPYGLAIDKDGILYVVDGSKGAEGLTIVDPNDGHMVDHFSGNLDGAHMLAVDRRGAIYVAEARGRSVRKFTR